MPRRAAVLGATLVALLLATWAASVGPHDVVRGDGPPRAEEIGLQHPDQEGSGLGGLEAPSETDSGSNERWGEAVFAVAQLVLAAVIVYVLVTIARRRRRLRWRRRDAPDLPHGEFDVLEPKRTVEALVADASLQQAMLLEGEPRNAIVACWHRFEVQASSVGLAREPWETSSEFTLRLLDLVSADPAAVAELSVLYREARFSDHDVDETSRARAVAALDVLHGGLRRRLGAGVGAS